ncbi:MAG: Cys-Gln thioester bond-forming surface protein [Clostridia bacterium]|nr:Cys-Gln thioester bond-forming surface protein [Clostridia bacterium]
MGKMKMMAFFKNPIVKDIFIVLMAVIMVTSIISIPVSNAGETINVAFRAVPVGVSVGSEDIGVQELAPGQTDKETKAKKYSSVFCIQKGKTLSMETYTSEYNVYNSEECSKYFTNYNSALWIFDNMYLAKGGNKDVALSYLAELVTSPDVQKNVTAYGKITADQIKSLNKTVGGYKDSFGNISNKNLIEIVEQLVLWNYTKNESQKSPSELVNGGFSGNNITDADQNPAKYLYYALKYLADKNSGYKSNGTVSNAIALDSSKAAIDVSKSKVGPYVLKSNGVAVNINNDYKAKMSATITTADGKTHNLGADKIQVIDNGSFYIDISGISQVTKSKLNIAEIYTGSTTKVEVLVNAKTQNLINIRKTSNTKPLSDEKTISYSGKYTIKLIKTKADGSTEITDNPAIFTITGAVEKKGEPTGKNGILTIASDKTISDASATDKYTIVEDTAPKGYTKYDGTIVVDVNFKAEGTSYSIDKDKTKLSANGKNGTVRLNVPNGNTIEIYVPNTDTEEEEPEFDLALRKFITKINGKEVSESRVPVIDAESKEILDKYNTAAYHHTKNSLQVEVGNEVEYTIRVYNEGEVDGVAKEITDYLPEGLSFVKLADESKAYTTESKAGDKKVVIKYSGKEVIKADSINRILNKETKNLYQEVKLICKVNKGAKGYITNRAEITIYGYTDKDGAWHEAKAIKDSDRDSVENTIKDSLGLDTWYENAKQYSYTDGTTIKTIKDYYPGVQDDDDFETVEVKEIVEEKEFDLALRKFITDVNGKEVTTRIPKVTLTDDFKAGKETTAKYEHPKDPVDVAQEDIVTYTIRLYNEGEVSGYATKVMDDIPDGLEFLPNNATNNEYGWVMYQEADRTIYTAEESKTTLKYNDKLYVETKDATKAELIVTDHLKDQLIKAYDAKTMKTLDYRDVKVAFKVVEPNSSDRIITNYAQITEHKDETGKTTVVDRDSTPNEWNEGEDDQDIEKIKLQEKEFDLALRKFITNINGKELESRIPTVKLSDDFKSGKVTTATYEHPKDPIDVVKDNIITYTIRVYNEGEADGYATKVMDDIPEGLEYLPSYKTNETYGWKMYVESTDAKAEGAITYNKKTYVPTEDASKADLIVTEYLKDQLIKGYNPKTMETLDYKDVKVAFKVIEPETSDKILINYAQITEHKDVNGNTKIDDRDSIPNEWNEGEDDQDIEKVRLRHFDLALRKWVTEAIVTENGQTVVTPTGHKAEDDPEDIVKVDLKKSKLNNVTVKFRYSIRVTNEGEIPGYAKEVTDYIPQGLVFKAEDNQGWTLAENNVAKTDALTNTLLNPGESAEVTIVLTWVNDANNMGVKTNTAEISKDYNEYGAQDIDSTPNNQKPGEDDIDDAPVMLTIKTGSEVISYVTLAVGFIAIVVAGIYTIKRRIV